MLRREWRLALVAVVGLLGGVSAVAAGQDAPPSTQQEPERDTDGDFNPAEPDFTLAGLPTAVRLPYHAWAFRVTHRFARNIATPEDLFGIDSGAQIGLELRYGLIRGAQVGIHRTSNRTIEFFGLYDLVRSGRRKPVGVSALVTVDGTDNFRESYSPAIGAVISHPIGERGALYAEPVWVNNSNPLPAGLQVDENSTLMLGLAARLMVRPATYLIVEASPRLAGYAPGRPLMTIGLEKLVGGHAFQVNVSNGFGTTFAQIARGGASFSDWHLGFSISRKFY